MNRYLNSQFYRLIFIVIATTLIGLGFVAVTNAMESSSVSYSYERYVSEKRYDRAEQWLENHTSEIEALMQSANGEKQTVLKELIRHNLEIINRSDIAHNYKLNNARSLVIAIDAIEKPNHPLLVKSKQALDKSLESVLASGDFSQQKINNILTHWEMLKPALQVALDKDEFQQLDLLFSNLGKETLNIKEDTESVFKYSQLIDIHTTTAQGDPLSFYWIILMVGGIIIITLSYVAWKKYKGEKKRKQKQPY
ncbi:Sporulation protein YpjB (SpoYpjB) [Paraliobacillus sp. PM-2]|uniref:sporulation protein YpjB n=1 Tax=Paraliobacillus sp. PM-2 TaxID=1462524 RepID=UPI00061BC87E|nr:sporulation protein YpjB [Paraliobacillus sp. PM-2]CQR46680.1 Sporulation protein YpjB (SpoYpjB) [Paraliobacillus sp. PM-2]